MSLLGSSDYYLMSKKRLRCKICRRDYPPFSGTPLSGLKISVVSLLLLIKLFELEISARKASTQLDISYPTTLKAFDLFRRSIACNLAKDDNLLKGEIEADISEEDEKESVVAVPVIRQLYLGSWNVGERFQSVSSRRLKLNP